MKYDQKKIDIIPIVILAIALFVAVSNGALAAIMDTSSAGSGPAINTRDIESAGFTSVRQQPQTPDGRYPSSNLYYWVDKPTDATDITADNLLMVSITTVFNTFTGIHEYPASQSFNVGDIHGLEGTEGNRTTIDFVKNNQYVVIIGPGKDKAEKMAVIVAGKIY